MAEVAPRKKAAQRHGTEAEGGSLLPLGAHMSLRETLLQMPPVESLPLSQAPSPQGVPMGGVPMGGVNLRWQHPLSRRVEVTAESFPLWHVGEPHGRALGLDVGPRGVGEA